MAEASDKSFNSTNNEYLDDSVVKDVNIYGQRHETAMLIPGGLD